MAVLPAWPLDPHGTVPGEMFGRRRSCQRGYQTLTAVFPAWTADPQSLLMFGHRRSCQHGAHKIWLFRAFLPQGSARPLRWLAGF